MHKLFAKNEIGADKRGARRRFDLDTARRLAYHTCINHKKKPEDEVLDRLRVLLGAEAVDDTLKEGGWPYHYADADTVYYHLANYWMLEDDETEYNKKGLQLRTKYRQIRNDTERQPYVFGTGVFEDWGIRKLKPFELWAIRYKEDHVGLYATKQAALRVLSGVRNPKTYSHLSRAVVKAKDAQDYLAKLHEAKHKLNYPIAAPHEAIHVRRQGDPRIKIQTFEHSGYTSTFESTFIALGFKEALLCAGDLSPYIEVERP